MSIRIEEEGTDSPQTVDEARDAVARSRERISSTLDALEDRIVEKKHEIQDRVDVLRPVREQIAERPLTAVMAGLAVGALLGALGGGDDDEYTRRRSGRISGHELDDDERDELKQWRRQRRKRLRAKLSRSSVDSDWPEVSGGPGSRSRSAGRGRGWDRDSDRDGRDDRSDSRFDALKHQLLGAVTSAITTAITTRLRRMVMDNVNSAVDSAMGSSRDHRGSRDDWQERDYSQQSRSGHSADGRGEAFSGARDVRGDRHSRRESYP